MVVPEGLEGVLESSPDTLHGALRFAKTRVFATHLFDYVYTGESIDTFLSDFPSVQREQVEMLLQWELQNVRGRLGAS